MKWKMGEGAKYWINNPVSGSMQEVTEEEYNIYHQLMDLMTNEFFELIAKSRTGGSYSAEKSYIDDNSK